MNVTHEELLPGTRRLLTHRVARGQSEGRAPSLVAAVARDGVPAWFGTRGRLTEAEPDADTQYRIGSLTKTFTAVLVLRLRDEGRLALTDTLRDHIPDALPDSVREGSVAGLPGDRAVGDLTLAQLLSHSSGLAAETPEPWWERTPGELRQDVAATLRTPPTVGQAGRRHHYSNSGYALLGTVIEKLRGVPWGEALRAEVLQPLGMTRTTVAPVPSHADGWAVHPWADVLLPEPAQHTGVMAPAGQLWSTAYDLCRWSGFLCSGRGPGRAPGADEVLCPDTLAEMRTPAVPPADEETWRSSYGLGLQLLRDDDRIFVGHGGSMPGFLAGVWVDVAQGVGGVALSNCTSGPEVGAIATDLVRTVTRQEPEPPAPWQPLGQADQELLELTGPWYWGPAPSVVRLRRQRMLELAPWSGGGRASRFRAETDGTWTGLDGYFAGEPLRVVRRADGTVSHLDIGSFVYTRLPYDSTAPIPGGVDADGWRGDPTTTDR